MEIRCKCHGMSGSCQLKTCWKSAPDFHIVGRVLKHQFRRAILVDQSNLGNGEPQIVYKRDRNKTQSQKFKESNDRHMKKSSEKPSIKTAKKLENYLLYYQRSPNFCEKDLSMDILGKSTCEYYLNILFVFYRHSSTIIDFVT